MMPDWKTTQAAVSGQLGRKGTSEKGFEFQYVLCICGNGQNL